ncbi:sulfite oxidase heme-binding subunit YedZ [Falsiroseomonas sp. HW251]|uniref:sulfite oxidase heme-binding subunit YedZ n=1 Tax=Falsiroseomonas sp. HW251 TaxID=3390998 RepID=UPI003D30F86F
MSRRTAAAPPARPTTPWPWLDRGGRFSPFRLSVLIGLCCPALVLVWLLATGQMGAEPWKEATRDAGAHAIHVLLLSLFVTPLRWIADWPKALTFRRMVGLAALAYVLLHLTIYSGDLAWNLLAVVSEIATRVYLTLGFGVLVGLSVLGWTSTDGSQRRLGPKWKKIHRWVYVLAALAVLHAFLQSKSRADDAVLAAGFYLWLMGWRLLSGRWRADPWALLALSVAVFAATVGLEFVWYATASRLPAARIAEANLGFDAGIRPAQWVLLAGLSVAMIPWLRRLARRSPRPA